MNVKLLTKQHLEFLRLKGGCTGSSESKLVKIQHCWKSRVAAHTSNKKHQCRSCSFFSTILLYTFKLLYSSVHLILSALYYLLTDLSILLQGFPSALYYQSPWDSHIWFLRVLLQTLRVPYKTQLHIMTKITNKQLK